jgi:hypothetical protein
VVTCKGAIKEEPYLYRILGIGGLEQEESRVFDSPTRKVASFESACARPWLWSLFQGTKERGLIPYAHWELFISAISESGGIGLKASNS